MSEEYSREYVEKHKRVMEKIEEVTSTNVCACIPVRKLAEESKMDERTAKAHLEILELHGVGTFLDSERRVFCTKKGIKKLATKLGLTVKESEE
jgi:hypothetical protein